MSNGGGLYQVVVLFGGDEDVFTAAGFGRLMRIAPDTALA